MNYWITKLSSTNTIDEKKDSLFIVNQMSATSAKTIGFKEINYVPFRNLQNKNRRSNLIESMVAPIQDGDLVVIQLPLWIDLDFQTELIDILKQKKSISLIGLLHTVIPYRDGKPYDSETNFFFAQLRKFDLLITPNEEVSKKLQQDQIKVPMIPLMGRDFLSQGFVRNKKFVKHLVYIAEHPVSSFSGMTKLETPLTIYGQGSPNLLKTEHINLCPDYTFEEIPYLLEGGFGLVKVPEIQEQMKNTVDIFSRNDAPFSMSIFLAAGLPLIVLESNPYADWVLSKRIGLVISDWSEIDIVVERTSATDYQIMLEGIKEMQEAVTSGVFTKNALLNAICELQLGYEKSIFEGNEGRRE